MATQEKHDRAHKLYESFYAKYGMAKAAHEKIRREYGTTDKYLKVLDMRRRATRWYMLARKLFRRSLELNDSDTDFFFSERHARMESLSKKCIARSEEWDSKADALKKTLDAELGDASSREYRYFDLWMRAMKLHLALFTRTFNRR